MRLRSIKTSAAGTSPQAVEDVLDQEAALNIDINGDGKIESEIEPEDIIDDHGDTVETATALTVGATAEGVIDIKGDRDVFTFDAAVGQRDQVAMDRVDLEWVELKINDPGGSYVGQYWSYDLLEFVFVAEEAGAYSLEASGGGRGHGRILYFSK